MIEDFAYPVLLGADFLTRVGAVFDLKHGVVYIATDSPIANEGVHLPACSSAGILTSGIVSWTTRKHQRTTSTEDTCHQPRKG